jgi:hypothetical protein
MLQPHARATPQPKKYEEKKKSKVLQSTQTAHRRITKEITPINITRATTLLILKEA